MKILGTVLILIFVSAAPAWAHDCWIQPAFFTLSLESLLLIKLLVGHNLENAKELPMDKKMTPLLSLVNRDKELDLLPVLDDKSLPAVTVQPDFEGTGLVAMHRDFSEIIMENDKFSSYITSEHHSHLLDQVKANPRGKQKEEYARCMKTLFQVGETAYDPEVASRETGQRLEILLLSMPKQPEAVRIRVLFDQKPLPNKTVTAFTQDQDNVVSQTSVTGESGEAVFENSGAGMWLIRLIHLFPSEGERDMDWTSYWGSFCFQMT